LVGGGLVNQISLAEYCQQIEDAIQDGRYEEAVAHGRHILERYPKYVGAYWLLGKAMLEAGQDDQAADMFRRVLSADPEHMLAWVGMSETAKRRDELEDAVWYLQRAFELATDNEMVAEELRHLYGELEGSEPQRLQLTESALAKLYLRGDLLTRAITELRKLIEEHPERLDLRVALAEALWRDGQRLQASQVCQEILEEQPYALKANLILGEIWSSSGRMAEAETYLERAEALDPENEMAQELFGSTSPLEPKEPQIEPTTYERGEERADWLIELEKTAPPEAEEAMEAEIQIPAWLQELAGETTAEAEEEELPAEAEREAEPAAEPPAPEEEIPVERPALEVAPEAMPEEETLDWLGELEEEEEEEEVAPSVGEEAEEEEIPAWLSEIEGGPEEEGIAVGEAAAAEEEPEGPEPAEIPDWLKDLAPPAAEPPEEARPEARAAALEEEMPFEEPVAGEPETEEIGLEELEAEEPEIGEPEAEAAEGMAELPAWLESDEMPSGDDALAWLAQLAEGKEEELRAQAEKEGEARLAEIMGRPGVPTEEAVPAEEVPEAVEPEAEPAVEEEETFGWTAFEEREELVPEAEEAVPAPEEAEELAVPAEAAPEATEAVPVAEEEAPPMEEPVPAPEEEEELVAPEEVAPEAPEAIPVAEEEAPPTEEAVPAEEAPEAVEPEAEPAVGEEEAFGWTAFEEREEVALEVEEAVPAPEEEEKELAVPEEAAPEAPEAVPVAEEEAPPTEEEPAPKIPEAVPVLEEEAVPTPEEEDELAVPEEIPPAEALEEAPTEDLASFIDAQQAYAEEHPEDYEALLELGRVLWQADRREDAMEAYERLIRKGKLLDDVIADLEDYTEQWPDARVMQSLGDAYVRADRLQDALETYREALASL
jgi:tetratricopeptide (TPR) repeat protein